ASRWKRARRSGSSAKWSGNSFSATSRWSLESWARKTTPIPPSPKGAVTVYGPMRVPAVGANCCIPERENGRSAYIRNGTERSNGYAAPLENEAFAQAAQLIKKLIDERRIDPLHDLPIFCFGGAQTLARSAGKIPAA